jgi:RHS repeat-associated protein
VVIEYENDTNSDQNSHKNDSASGSKYAGYKPKSTAIYAIHTDHLGTPQAITDDKQAVVWRADYATFGKATVQARVVDGSSKTAKTSFGIISSANAATATAKPFEFNLRFAGQYEDSESGYHYNWHRYYDPSTGRYLTPDPIGLAGGLNGYGYAGQDPMGAVDPFGLRSYIEGGRIYIVPEDPTVPRINLPNNVGAVGIGPSNTFFHRYDVKTPSNITSCQASTGFTNNATPGNDSPATPTGTRNDAGPIFTAGENNYVNSYLVASPDSSKYTDIVVNHTIKGDHGLNEGYVIRYGEIQSDGSIILRSYGEGNDFRQTPLLKPIWGPKVDAVWQANAKEIIANAGKCGCK